MYYLIMTTIATVKSLNIIDRIEKKRKVKIINLKHIFHAIVVPVYQEDLELVRNTLEFLSKHLKAK